MLFDILKRAHIVELRLLCILLLAYLEMYKEVFMRHDSDWPIPHLSFFLKKSFPDNFFEKFGNPRFPSIIDSMKKNLPFLSLLIQEVAPEIGAMVWLEPEFWYVWEIVFSNGKRHLFRKWNFNINPLGSIEIVKDKGYTSMFLERFWYHVVPGKVFFSEEKNHFYGTNNGIEEAWQYALSLGLPIILKPNNLSQGIGVEKIYAKNRFIQAVHTLLEYTDIYRVEAYFRGRDYRLVVLDDEVISAYERVPLSLIWDGNSTIRELLLQKQSLFELSGRDTILDLDDPRILENLNRKNLNFDAILGYDVSLQLLDNANLSSWGESIDRTGNIHSDFIKIAIEATRDMWLRLSGVDIMCANISEAITAKNPYVIIELNWAPWLDHYISTGNEQKMIVKSLYKKILLALEKM